jgi:sugar lactone lactonase YvrE
MTWTLTATAEPAHTPPRVKLEATESDPLISLRTVDFFRDGVKLRFEAAIAAQYALVYDYDAPFDELLNYRADATGVDVKPEFSETWGTPSTPPTGWTGSGWAAASGIASSTAPFATIYRDTTTAITSVAVTNPSNVKLELLDADDKVLAAVNVTPDGYVVLSGADQASYALGSGSYVLSIALASVSVAGTGWAIDAPFEGVATRVRLVAPAAFTFVEKYPVTSLPMGLAFNSAGDMYVVDYNRAKIVKYVLSGGSYVYDSEFGTYGSGSGQFDSIYGIAIDASDNIWTVDYVRNKILKFNSSGVFQAEYGSTGSGNGQLNGPVDIAFKSTGNFVVTDYGNGRVQEFSPAGAYVSKFSVAGGPNGVAIGASDDIILTLWDANEVRRYNASGVLQDTFDDVGIANPNFVARDSSGYVYVTDWFNGRVVKFDSTGTYVSEFGTVGGSDGEFWYANGIEVRASGDLYVADGQPGGASTIKKLSQAVGSVDDVVVSGAGRPTLASDEDTETLAPTGDYAGAWIVNAAQPASAILAEAQPATVDDPYFIVTSSRESSDLEANSVELRIEGSADIITAALGPRLRERWTLDVACTTEAARKGLLALLANSAAIHLRFPASDRWEGLEGGFYAVGAVATERIGHPQYGPVIVVSMPLVPARTPAYKPLWQWNARTLAQTGMTARDVKNTYATARDLLIGPV